MLSEKKLQLLELGGKIEIGYARDYAILAGAKEYTAVRKRLSELCKDGFMTEGWRNGRKVYYLTQKGIRQIETHMRKPYNPAGYTTEHALYVAEYAAYIHLKGNVSVDSMVFDREMEGIEQFKPKKNPTMKSKRKKAEDKTHAPDLIIGGICYEIELTVKSKTRLKTNFGTNAKYFGKQVWIVPQRLHSLQNSINALSKEFGSQTVIVAIENVEKYLKECDISRNEKGRDIALKIKEPERKNILEELT